MFINLVTSDCFTILDITAPLFALVEVNIT